MSCPRIQQASLPASSPHYSFFMLSAKQRSCEYHFLKSWYDSTREMNPRSTDCNADALTTIPSRRYLALISLFFAKMRLLLTLTLSPLTIWCSGLMALFLFILAKAALAYLPTAPSVAPRPLFPFQQGQYDQVFPLKPAPFCNLFAGLGSTNKPATFLLFLFSNSRSVLTTLSSYFFLPQFLAGTVFSPVLSDYNGSPDTRFFRGALLTRSAIPCSLPSYLSYPLLSFLGREAYGLI